MTDAKESRAQRVLVVDDEELLRILARESLELAGYEVIEADDGARGLELLEQTNPDIVLLDVKMPVMDGFTACARMRETPAGRHKPILMMTSLDDGESIRRAFDAGATDFDVKPTNWAILSHRVEYMLRAGRGAQELRANRSKLVNAQRIARLGYWEWDRGTGELSCSDELARILGLDPTTPPRRLDDLLASVHADDRELMQREISEVLDHADGRSVQFRLLRTDGSERFVQQQAERVLDERGEIVGLSAIVQDITERRRAQEEIRFLAYYDGLTSLPNRKAFNEKLELALFSASRHERLTALLLLDLDRFQRINDTLGLAAGDQLLQQVAERLLTCVRSTDVVGRPGVGDVVARLDGDEFGVLLTEVADSRNPGMVAERLGQIIAEPFEVQGQSLFLTASTGITVFPEDGRDAATLTLNAEAAMFHAKQAGGNSLWYYSRSMNAETAERLKLDADLRGALGRDELELYYQPFFDVSSRRPVGAEALLRWRHPRRGLLSPDTFIPLAEESGLILEIGEWVLREACRQIVAWRAAGLGNIPVSVNLSTRQLDSAALPALVAEILGETSIGPHLLGLEITERNLMRDPEDAGRCLEALKALGVRLLVDDFGTGYSSLSYLSSFPLDSLKIDRSFISGLPADRSRAALTTAIIAMARSLEMGVIAEGVETDEQLAFIRAQGCDVAQGFLLCRPQPAEELARLLAGSLRVVRTAAAS